MTFCKVGWLNWLDYKAYVTNFFKNTLLSIVRCVFGLSCSLSLCQFLKCFFLTQECLKREHSSKSRGLCFDDNNTFSVLWTLESKKCRNLLFNASKYVLHSVAPILQQIWHNTAGFRRIRDHFLFLSSHKITLIWSQNTPITALIF